jgi:general secretion pathway protein J
MRRPRPVKNAGVGGFTLVEMLVVFGVFALIGVVTSQILGSVIANQRVMAERGARLAEVQRALQIIQRDLLQVSARSVRDVLGDPLPPLIIDADGVLEFTRLGWRNPLARQRSELQRISYVIQDGDLYRAYWPVLDRAPDSEPLLQELLPEVERVEFVVLDRGGSEHSFWPREDGGSPLDPSQRVAGIVMRIELPPFGLVERVWPVPGV